MPSADRKRFDRETTALRNDTADTINRNRFRSDRYGDNMNADREQKIARGEPIFNRMGGGFGRQTDAIDQMGRNQGRMDEYADYGSSATTGLEGGYSPEALAAMKGQAIDAVPGRFDAAAQQLRTQQLRRGGGGGAPAGGDYSRDMGNLYSQREQTRAGTLRNITVEDEKLKRDNILANRAHGLAKRGVGLQALGLGAGVDQARSQAAQGYSASLNNSAQTVGDFYNPNAYIAGQTSLAGTEADLARTRAGQIRPEDTRPGFWKQLGGAALGAGLGFLTGGVSNMAGGGGFFGGARGSAGGYGPAGPPPERGGYG